MEASKPFGGPNLSVWNGETDPMSKTILSRRRFLQVSGASAVGLALAACEAPMPAAEEAAPTMETIALNHWGFGGPVWEAQWEAVPDALPHIEVNSTEIGDIVFGDQKYLTAVAAGTGPDTAIQGRHTFLQFAAKGLYQDLTDQFAAAGLGRGDFSPVQLDESTWEGRTYGMPWDTDVRYLYWNKEHFAEAGLDPEQPPTTWAELEEYTAVLDRREGDEVERYGFVPYLWGNSWMWLYGFLAKAPAISDDKRTILCDDPKWIEVLTWLVNFYDNYVGDFEAANAFQQSVNSAGLGDPFIAGKVSMSATGNWVVRDILRSPGIVWDTAPMPIPPGGEKSTWSCGFNIVMAPDSQHPAEAFQIMQWFTGIDGWDALAAADLADVKRTWEREQLEGDPQFWPRLACYLPALEAMEQKYIPQLGETEQRTWELTVDALQNWTHGCGSVMGLAALQYWVEMDNAARNALSKVMTPEEAMLNCKKLVQEATDQAWEAIDNA